MSGFKVTLLDDAVSDIKLGKQFYEEREKGIGSYFADSALADIASLKLYAGIHSIRYGYHRMLVKRFPFAAYYDIDDRNARVVAVLDMRRDPKSISAILKSRNNK